MNKIRKTKIESLTSEEKKSYYQIERYWSILLFIASRTIPPSTNDIHQYITEQPDHQSINIRTTQRNLKVLSYIFDKYLESNNSKPQKWRWKKTNDVILIPGLAPETALTFDLAKRYLEPLLPKSALKHMQPHFNNAKDVLNQLNQPGFKNWSSKIRVVPEGQPLQPANVSEKILNTVYQALLEDKCLRIKYHAASNNKKKKDDPILHPVGLIFRYRVNYLIAIVENDNKRYRRFHLGRIEKATVLDNKSHIPKDRSLDDFIDSGELDIPIVGDSKKELSIELKFTNGAGFHLTETPINNTQSIENKPNNTSIVKAQVRNTRQLCWWILGFGDSIEVLKPKSLRDEITTIVNNMSLKYK